MSINRPFYSIENTYTDALNNHLLYYAFGSSITEMQYASDTAGRYRYGFNGEERDIEALEGCIAFEARIFDTRIARFFSTDPKESVYPWQTPFAYYMNCPIAIIDIDGEGGPYDPKATGEEDLFGETINNNEATAQNNPVKTTPNGNVCIVIGDDESGLTANSKALEDLGYKIITVKTGQELISALKNFQDAGGGATTNLVIVGHGRFYGVDGAKGKGGIYTNERFNAAVMSIALNLFAIPNGRDVPNEEDIAKAKEKIREDGSASIQDFMDAGIKFNQGGTILLGSCNSYISESFNTYLQNPNRSRPHGIENFQESFASALCKATSLTVIASSSSVITTKFGQYYTEGRTSPFPKKSTYSILRISGGSWYELRYLTITNNIQVFLERNLKGKKINLATRIINKR